MHLWMHGGPALLHGKIFSDRQKGGPTGDQPSTVDKKNKVFPMAGPPCLPCLLLTGTQAHTQQAQLAKIAETHVFVLRSTRPHARCTAFHSTCWPQQLLYKPLVCTCWLLLLTAAKCTYGCMGALHYCMARSFLIGSLLVWWLLLARRVAPACWSGGSCLLSNSSCLLV